MRRPPAAGDPDAPIPPCTEPGQIARRAKLTKQDFEKYGYTEGCIGCRHTERHGKTNYGHNELCRRRIEGELKKDESGRQRVERCGIEDQRADRESAGQPASGGGVGGRAIPQEEAARWVYCGFAAQY